MSTNADEFARRLGASVPGAALSGLQSLPGFESLTEHDKIEILNFATFLQKRAAEKAAGVEPKNSTAAMEVYGDFNGE